MDKLYLFPDEFAARIKLVLSHLISEQIILVCSYASYYRTGKAAAISDLDLLAVDKTSILPSKMEFFDINHLQGRDI